MSDTQSMTLSYCIKGNRKQPVWRGPIAWDRDVPAIGAVIEITSEFYGDAGQFHVLDSAVAEQWDGRGERHITVYVERDTAPPGATYEEPRVAAPHDAEGDTP